MYFLYDPKEVRQLHLEGVSLWDGLPKATLSEALLPVCREVLPEPAYQVVSDRVSRKPNPAPALQDKVEKKPEFDGILFEDVVFDARGRLVFSVLLSDTPVQRVEVARGWRPRRWPMAFCRPIRRGANSSSHFAFSIGTT